MKTLAAALTSAVVMMLLAGCGTSPIPTPTFGFDSDAVSIARAVKACRAPTNQAVPANSTGISSVATCLINGSQVDFIVWKDAAAQAEQSPTKTATTETWVAHGDGWDAATHDSGRISQQKVVVETIVGSAGGTAVHVG
jgi:hypothetical protein